MKIDSIWDFIEKYYPNYDTCSDIQYNEDLYKLVNREYEIGSTAYYLLIHEYDGDINNPEIENHKILSDSIIYRESIKGYLNSKNESFSEQLKKIKSIINESSLIQWFNDNDIEYIHMSTIDMYIYYFENI